MLDLLISQKIHYRIIRHILLFLSMVLLFSWVASSQTGGHDFLGSLLMVFINALFFFGYAYLTVYLLIPKLLVRRRYILFVLLFLLSGAILSGLKFLASDFVFYQAIAPENGPLAGTVSVSKILVNTKDMTFIVALFALVKFARDRYILESNIRELQKKGLEAELKLLEHQMDPHVIFNNFNSLYSISINKPAYLKSTVNKLRSLLHYLFNESKKDKVLLTKEVEMIENYIGLEKLRFGDRLDITFRQEGQLDGLKIAPLILYSFVENCFVHGAGEDPYKSWIHIELNVKDSRLFFLAANSVSEHFRGGRDSRKSGTDENSLRRLDLQYPNSHRVTIRERSHDHQVELNVSL
jgi:two-component system LytT family sensor kinase